MKRKTATITFHAAHNYGSMLQAYALQQTLLSLGLENEIINLRTPKQREIYSDPRKRKFTTFQEIFKNLIIRLTIPSYNKGLRIKYDLFERFLSSKLKLTKEYRNSKELKELSDKYDYLITGSDQCWNTTCSDFDWAYYLTFSNTKNKISYASSLGPMKDGTIYEDLHDKLEGYRNISAREEGTAKYLENILLKDIPILPDPTLLLPQNEWEKLVGEQRIYRSNQYIFVYTPHLKNGLMEVAMGIAKILNMPLVVSNITREREDMKINIFNRNVHYKLDIGPIQFLNLIKNAELVITGSFHAILFSIIFHTPFFAFNGLEDNRMRHILQACELDSRSITVDNYISKISGYKLLNFIKADNWISQKRNEAIQYLKDCFDLS